MSAETDLVDALEANAAVVALLQISGVSPTELRIYPDVVAQEIDLPAVAFQRLATEYNNTIHAIAPTSAQISIDIWCMADTRSVAESIGDAVEGALAPAAFLLVGRRGEIDPDDPDRIIWATVLSVVRNQQLS